MWGSNIVIIYDIYIFGGVFVVLRLGLIGQNEDSYTWFRKMTFEMNLIRVRYLLG
jgi:hypothetical protein